MKMPLLLVKDGKVIYGEKRDIPAQCSIIRTDNRAVFYAIKTDRGQALIYDNEYYLSAILTPIIIEGNLESLEYMGNISISNEEQPLCYIYASCDRQIYIGFRFFGDSIVKLCRIIYFTYLGYDGFIKNTTYSSDSTKYKIIKNYLVLTDESATYLFKDLKLIYQWKDIEVNFVTEVINKGLVMNKVEEYLKVINKLVGLSKMRNKIGAYNIDNILKGYTEVDIEMIAKMLDNPQLIEETLCDIPKPIRQFQLALTMVNSVKPLITNPKYLKEISKVSIKKELNGIGIYIAGYRTVYFLDRIIPFQLYNKSSNLQKYLIKFAKKNSLSAKLNRKQILLWARFLKNLNKKQILIN